MPQVRYNVQSPPLPANWHGNLRALHQYIIENLQVLSGEATSSFVTGPNPPATDVGPWLAYDKSWRVWDASVGGYVPQFLEQPSLDRLISFAATAPLTGALPGTGIWVSGSGAGASLGLNQWSGSAWAPANLKLGALSTKDGGVRIGSDRTSAGEARLELWGLNGVSTAYLLREAGANGDLSLVNTGTGTVRISSVGPVVTTVNGIDRISVLADGTVNLLNGTRLSVPSGMTVGGASTFEDVTISGAANFTGSTTFSGGIIPPSGVSTSRPGSPAPYTQFYDVTISALIYFKPGFGWVTVAGTLGEVKFVWQTTEVFAVQFNPGWEVEGTLKGFTLAGANGSANGMTERAPGDSFGEENHALTAPEGPPHSHLVGGGYAQNGGDVLIRQLIAGAYNSGAPVQSTTSSTGSGTAHNNIQPTKYLIVMRKTQ